MTKVSVIYPTYNEKDSAESNLRNIYDNFRKFNLNPEVIIVDDSKDGSEKIFEELCKRYKNLKLIHRVNEKGVGSAIIRGIENASGEYILVSMFDSPQEINYFPEIIRKLDEGYDVVQTSRFIKNARMVGYPLKKLIFNRLGNNLISFLFLRFDLKDFTSLFKGFRKDKVMSLDLESNDFNLGLEISTKSIRKKYKIVEIPVDWYERNVGQSNLNVRKEVPRYLKRLFNTWLFYR